MKITIAAIFTWGMAASALGFNVFQSYHDFLVVVGPSILMACIGFSKGK